MERLQYVDVFRGVAILVMILYHFINALSPVNVYVDWPYFIPSLGLITFPSPSFLFLAVAGMSSYLLVTKRRNAGWDTDKIVKHVSARYGPYLLISVPFTVLLWDLATWLAWEEALQGIALTIIVLAVLQAYVSVTVTTGFALITFSAVIQGYRHELLAAVLSTLPPVQHGLLIGTGAALWNAFAGGFFSVTALLPYAVAGVILIKLLYEKETSWQSIPLGVASLLVTLVLVWQGFSIGFYARDVPITFYGVATVFLTYYVLFHAWGRWQDARVFELLAAYGRQAFLVYIWTWVLMVRPIELSPIAAAFTHGQAVVLSLLLIAGTVVLAARYDTYRSAHGPLVNVLRQRVLR